MDYGQTFLSLDRPDDRTSFIHAMGHGTSDFFLTAGEHIERAARTYLTHLRGRCSGFGHDHRRKRAGLFQRRGANSERAMKFQIQKNSRLVAALIFWCGINFLFANPTGMTVVSGSATPAQQNGSQLNVTTSQSAFLNWSSFNIQAGETTTFLQPSVNSVVINEIGGANPSQIFGSLNANGTVILANANGFYFGPNSMISVGGSFIATTAPLTPDFGAGSAWQFTGMPPLASIVNYGADQRRQRENHCISSPNMLKTTASLECARRRCRTLCGSGSFIQRPRRWTRFQRDREIAFRLGE
jgi:filamentous hemagglutinin family protein